jgi:hypothetical protein
MDEVIGGGFDPIEEPSLPKGVVGVRDRSGGRGSVSGGPALKGTAQRKQEEKAARVALLYDLRDELQAQRRQLDEVIDTLGAHAGQIERVAAWIAQTLKPSLTKLRQEWDARADSAEAARAELDARVGRALGTQQAALEELERTLRAEAAAAGARAASRAECAERQIREDADAATHATRAEFLEQFLGIQNLLGRVDERVSAWAKRQDERWNGMPRYMSWRDWEERMPAVLQENGIALSRAWDGLLQASAARVLDEADRRAAERARAADEVLEAERRLREGQWAELLRSIDRRDADRRRWDDERERAVDEWRRRVEADYLDFEKHVDAQLRGLKEGLTSVRLAAARPNGAAALPHASVDSAGAAESQSLAAAVRAHLQNAGLGQYADALLANGYTSPAALRAVEATELAEVGVLPGHRRGLLDALRSLPDAPTPQAAPSAAEREPVAEPDADWADRRRRHEVEARARDEEAVRKRAALREAEAAADAAQRSRMDELRAMEEEIARMRREREQRAAARAAARAAEPQPSVPAPLLSADSILEMSARAVHAAAPPLAVEDSVASPTAVDQVHLAPVFANLAAPVQLAPARSMTSTRAPNPEPPVMEPVTEPKVEPRVVLNPDVVSVPAPSCLAAAPATAVEAEVVPETTARGSALRGRPGAGRARRGGGAVRGGARPLAATPLATREPSPEKAAPLSVPEPLTVPEVTEEPPKPVRASEFAEAEQLADDAGSDAEEGVAAAAPRAVGRLNSNRFAFLGGDAEDEISTVAKTPVKPATAARTAAVAAKSPKPPKPTTEEAAKPPSARAILGAPKPAAVERASAMAPAAKKPELEPAKKPAASVASNPPSRGGGSSIFGYDDTEAMDDGEERSRPPPRAVGRLAGDRFRFLPGELESTSGGDEPAAAKPAPPATAAREERKPAALSPSPIRPAASTHDDGVSAGGAKPARVQSVRKLNTGRFSFLGSDDAPDVAAAGDSDAAGAAAEDRPSRGSARRKLDTGRFSFLEDPESAATEEPPPAAVPAASRRGGGIAQRAALFDAEDAGAGSAAAGPTPCTVCARTAHLVDRVTVDGRVFHRECVRCSQCTRVLGVGQLTSVDRRIFCKPCFRKWQLLDQQ